VISGSLARRYAKALMDIGADDPDKKKGDKLGADVRQFAEAMKTSPELVVALTNPAFPRDDRKKVVEALATRFKVDPITRNFLYVLLDKERLAHLPAISREIDRVLAEQTGHISAEVVSAMPLTAAQTKQITATLEKLSGKKVDVVKREDPSLLGGVVAKVGDVIYDGSVKNQLRQLRDSLVK
jgi:F-type H+-transporting ATPase subunit delta